MQDPDEAFDVRVQVDGRAVFARVWGGAERCRHHPTFLLFHDSLGSVELWRDFPAVLAQVTRCPVIAYDRVGFGQSAASEARLGDHFYGDEAETSVPALLSHLGVWRLIPFGHSVGGSMAIVTGGHFADMTLAVVTESAQAFVESRTVAGLREAKTTFADPGQLARLARYHGDKATWVLDAWLETWLRPSFAHFSLDDALGRLRCPVLALHGDRDEFGSRAHPERIVAHAPAGSEMVLLRDCGHVPHRERQADVLHAVTRFLHGHGLLPVESPSL